MVKGRAALDSDARWRETSSSFSAAESATLPVSATVAHEQLAGTVIAGRYRLVRPIGSGGMGVVWVARSLSLEVDVALKLIHAGLAGPAGCSRLAREAHATARLAHPAIVRVFDLGWTERGTPFIVMELMQGESLSALLRRQGYLSAVDAVRLLLPVLDGLRTAHGEGIIHRDIKPENVFVARDAFGCMQPKLFDFGLAKLQVLRASDPGSLTEGGLVVGSMEYMAPEQTLGLEVDCRADVWACCVVLYECIAGLPPWPGPNSSTILRGIVNDPPRPLAHHAGGDEGLWSILERGLRKDPDERWSSVTELGEALALWLYQRGIREDVSGNSVCFHWLDEMPSHQRLEGGSRPPVSRALAPTLAPPTPALLSARPSRARARALRGMRRRPAALRRLFGLAFGLLVCASLFADARHEPSGIGRAAVERRVSQR